MANADPNTGESHNLFAAELNCLGISAYVSG